MIRVDLSRILADLGGTLLELVRGEPETVSDIGGVVIYDAVDDLEIPSRAVVLGVGVHDAAGIVRVLEEVGDRAGALVVRSPVEADAQVREAADRHGIVLLSAATGASWMQLAAMLRSLLGDEGVSVVDTETLGGLPAGDLFALANAIAAQLDAPVTIEDRGSRLLAFSDGQLDSDRSRVETVLGRQVPERYVDVLAERGVFDELYRSDRPIYVDSGMSGLTADLMSRTAIAVRAGDEVLGSIWAAVHEPLSDEHSDAFIDAAKLAALHLMRVRAGADVHRRLHVDLLSTALEGGTGGRAALERLGLARTPVVVLALARLDSPDARSSVASETTGEAARQRLSDGFAMHLAAVHPRSAVALVEQVVYGLLPVGDDVAEPEEPAARIAREFLRRLGTRGDAVIAVGSCAYRTTELAGARSRAGRVLRALRARGEGGAVARFGDVHAEVVILEARDIAAAQGDAPTGAVARLRVYDARHHSNLVGTLAAWLDSLGDISAAADMVHVHPNTFRYRLRRVSEVGGMDLTDREQRFAAMLQLRVLCP
ncbi:MAG: PucR family transcriptional regulator [Nocardioidaceae bacterium]